MSYTTLISTTQLAESSKQSNWVIFDCRASLFDFDAGLHAYNEGHIPNSHYCDLENDLSSNITANTGRHPLPDFKKFVDKLQSWGVNNQSQVVVYDDVGGALAVRLWWQLRTLGHKNVALLDGGITQWIKQEKALSTESTTTKQSTFIPIVDENAWLSTKQIEQNLTSKSFVILDARTPERYRGEEEPIDPVAGRVPNALNRAFQLNLGQDGLFLSADELQKQFADIIKKVPQQSAENIVHLCGSGVTACHNMLAMEVAGLTGSRLYAGSWSEWIRDTNRPIATG